MDLAEAYLVGLRDFSVPLGHEPAQDAAEFRLRGPPVAAIRRPPHGQTERREARDEDAADIAANRRQLLEAMDAWASGELGARAVS